MGKPIRVQIPVRPPKFTTENRRHEVERERSAAVKLADALDLGATGKPVRVQIPVPAPKSFFNIPDNHVDNLGLVQSKTISRHMPQSPKITPIKIPKIFFS